MMLPAITEPHVVAARVGFVKWIWLGLLTIACGFVGLLQLGALHTAEIVDGYRVVTTLATAAQSGQQDSGPSYIDHIEWTTVGNRSSLRVYPTAAGRQASTRLLAPNRAWAQVVKLAPDAERPGMREQFLCHWRFAEFGKRGKASWNLEPWRPLVGDIDMIASRCNPGGNEESY